MSPARTPGTLLAQIRGADTAAANGDPALDRPRRHGPRERDDEVRIVVVRVELAAPKSTTSCPAARSRTRRSSFRPNPPWSVAIPTRRPAASRRSLLPRATDPAAAAVGEDQGLVPADPACRDRSVAVGRGAPASPPSRAGHEPDDAPRAIEHGIGRASCGAVPDTTPVSATSLSVTSSTGSPGTSDAVWPSLPRPRRARSSTGGCAGDLPERQRVRRARGFRSVRVHGHGVDLLGGYRAARSRLSRRWVRFRSGSPLGRHPLVHLDDVHRLPTAPPRRPAPAASSTGSGRRSGRRRSGHEPPSPHALRRRRSERPRGRPHRHRPGLGSS